jgi:hypothetical protein
MQWLRNSSGFNPMKNVPHHWGGPQSPGAYLWFFSSCKYSGIN